jgi:hypothetical protein
VKALLVTLVLHPTGDVTMKKKDTFIPACVTVSGEIPVYQMPCHLNGNLVTYDPVFKTAKIHVKED